jgi:carboxyl-terminal processing protease
VILKVNGEDVTGQPLDMVIAKIVGPAGTKVVLSIQSASAAEPRDVTITRQRIDVHSVTWAMLPDTHTAHIHIAGFSDGVTKDLQAAITDATKQGATAIVLDLRNNPGGLLSESIGVASEFLRSGNVLQEKNAQGQVTMVPVHPTDTTTDLPMVVLINQGTASASEIVAGALQDAGRARLIGDTTFGTGTVLNEFTLSDGSALLLATEEWLTPGGRVIWHQGIVPDSKVALSAQASPLTPESEQGLTGAQLQASQDTQLLQGLQILQKGLLSAHRATESGTVK